jgi:hypothetical protein
MNYQRGQLVMVADFKGEKLARRVWEDTGERVFITSDQGMREMASNQHGVWPIGVTRASITLLKQENEK